MKHSVLLDPPLLSRTSPKSVRIGRRKKKSIGASWPASRLESAGPSGVSPNGRLGGSPVSDFETILRKWLWRKR
jgi:hypothetical protein